MWKEVFRVELPGLPPSTNSIWRNVKGRTIKSATARAWDAMSIPLIRRAVKDTLGYSFFSSRERMPLRIELLFYRPTWYCTTKTLKNNFKRIDLDNRCKAAIDSLMMGLGLDDSAVFEIMLRKVTDKEGSERTLINLCFWEREDA